MLEFQFDPQSGVPAYKQMMNQIKYYISSGVLRAGYQLPSIRELASAMSINPTTVNKSLKLLELDGVVESFQGKGFFVAEGAQGFTEPERRAAIRRLSRQLLIEARQMGASELETMQVIDEERVAMNPDTGLLVSLRLTEERRGR